MPATVEESRPPESITAVVPCGGIRAFTARTSLTRTASAASWRDLIGPYAGEACGIQYLARASVPSARSDTRLAGATALIAEKHVLSTPGASVTR